MGFPTAKKPHMVREEDFPEETEETNFLAWGVKGECWDSFPGVFCGTSLQLIFVFSDGFSLFLIKFWNGVKEHSWGKLKTGSHLCQ